jgi:proteasome lid subunit RPN8/RPN11
LAESQEDVNYAAIITISLPGADQITNLAIELTPADPIDLIDGRTKLLRDCTLAELQAVADAVETQVWARYQEDRLADLAANDEVLLGITILNPPGEAISETGEAWLERAVRIPVVKEQRSVDSGEEPAEIVAEDEELAADLHSDDETPETETVTEPPAELLDAEEAAQEEAPEDVAVGDEREAILSESEIAELEPEVEKEPAAPDVESIAPPSVTLPKAPARLRILGRRRPLGHSTWTIADILINEPAFRNAQAHSLTSLDREVAGVMIGPPPEKQPDGRYLVHISDTIIAKHTRMQGASVTYTPESWRHVNDKLAEMYPDESAVIVGWYHTHPGFGIFLSGMDQFIHQNFFTQPWHVAMVLDPVAQRSGFFCWDRGRSRVDRYEFPWPSWAANSW